MVGVIVIAEFFIAIGSAVFVANDICIVPHKIEIVHCPLIGIDGEARPNDGYCFVIHCFFLPFADRVGTADG